MMSISSFLSLQMEGFGGMLTGWNLSVAKQLIMKVWLQHQRCPSRPSQATYCKFGWMVTGWNLSINIATFVTPFSISKRNLVKLFFEAFGLLLEFNPSSTTINVTFKQWSAGVRLQYRDSPRYVTTKALSWIFRPARLACMNLGTGQKTLPYQRSLVARCSHVDSEWTWPASWKSPWRYWSLQQSLSLPSLLVAVAWQQVTEIRQFDVLVRILLQDSWSRTTMVATTMVAATLATLDLMIMAPLRWRATCATETLVWMRFATLTAILPTWTAMCASPTKAALLHTKNSAWRQFVTWIRTSKTRTWKRLALAKVSPSMAMIARLAPFVRMTTSRMTFKLKLNKGLQRKAAASLKALTCSALQQKSSILLVPHRSNDAVAAVMPTRWLCLWLHPL